VPEQPGGQGRALDTVWLGWAALGENLESRAGMRFDVRVNFGSASIAEQGLFHLRRLFLRVIRI
jgi:putative peptide zinc metalloprotease protein